ncbi:hypothetical protein DICPUDRAFT_79814 [Dictyostelium purpureum]|uniref:Uncharacterized protein n=1 Tax=Dictyostelium purpureum TaxID=5786 RepID=F0ZNP8_DICPU|nr:uncharacterized protein DICPUDRAFT_79814 [Dictyostelium purpureum]EGC34448.1 hypothetical protein DICPUDRAFT_79814 [Dictyostelium purpureum]|eukprot:XP_003289033.1 hypothetical protein DICPUDRAFT_79814 [Dictyostelium purpureum]
MNNSNNSGVVRVPQKFKFEFDVNIQEWKANNKSLLLLTSSEIREIISSHGYDLKSYFYKKDDLLNKLKDILNGTSNNGMNGGISISINSSSNTTPTISPKLTSSNSNINGQYNGNSANIISNSSNIQYSNSSVPYYNNSNNYNGNKRSIEQVSDPYELQIASDDENTSSSGSTNGYNNNGNNSNGEYQNIEYNNLPPKKKFSTSPTNTSAQTSTNTSPIQQPSTIQLFKTSSITQTSSNVSGGNNLTSPSASSTLNVSTTGINTLSNLSLSASSNNLSTLASCSLNNLNNNNSSNNNNNNSNNTCNGNSNNNNSNNIVVDKNSVKRALELEQRILGSFSFYFMMKKLDFSNDFSLRVQEEFVRFIVLKVMDNDHGCDGFGNRLVPSPIIDSLYREIILNTIKHKELLNLIKLEIHYHSGHNETSQDKEKKYQRTLTLYSLYFGKNKNSDNEIIWPSTYSSNYNSDEALNQKVKSLKSKNRERKLKIEQLEKEILNLKSQLNNGAIEEELGNLNNNSNNNNENNNSEKNKNNNDNDIKMENDEIIETIPPSNENYENKDNENSISTINE